MPGIDIIRESRVNRTARVKQLEGIFDLPPSQKTVEKWHVDLPLDDKEWNIGLIVGPSGCGKTTIVNEFFPNHVDTDYEWGEGSAIIDDFPDTMGIKEITSVLSSVGFSSPPSWMRPYHVLSNGEKFFHYRCFSAP